MGSEVSRHTLFLRFRGGPTQIRPPWSRHERLFTEACTLCGKCREACPTGIIVKGHAGYPIVSFAGGGCTFCGACADVCEAGCFDRTGEPWNLKAAISSACIEPKGVACRMCGDACAADAIIFRPKLGGGSVPIVRLGECTGCGMCVACCPVDAISLAVPAALEATA